MKGIKVVTSKSGRKYKRTDAGWKLLRNVGATRKVQPTAMGRPVRTEVLAARVRLVQKAKGDRKRIAALLRSFRKVDR